MAIVPRVGDLPVALARLGYDSPADASRHLEAVALGVEGTLRVAKACATAPDPDLAVAQVCRWIAMSGRVPNEAGLRRLASVLGLSTSLGAFVARHPDTADMLIDARHLSKGRSARSLFDEALRVVGETDDPNRALRFWKRRELLRTVSTGRFLARTGDYRIELREAGRVSAAVTLTVAADADHAVINACEPLLVSAPGSTPRP